MGEIMFAVPRTVYGSYQDLYRLIELSDFPTCFIDEIDPQSDNAYILTVLNGEIPDGGWPDAKAHIVIWDNEWRRQPNAPIPGLAEFWTCDQWHANICQCRYVPMGSHPGLRLSNEPAELQYDVSFLAYMVYRRQRIHDDLEARGVKLSPTSAWGEERDAILRASKVYLHVHQHDDIPAVPGLRMVVAAAYSLPVISEDCADAAGFTHLMFRYPYGNLIQGVVEVLNLPQLADAGEQLHYILCERMTFRRSVEAAL